MYFILDHDTEKTLATSNFEDVAHIMANNFPTKCIVRYVETSNQVYPMGTNFFKEDNRKRKRA